MTTIGLHKIIGQMFRGPMTLSEISKFTKLAKPTVHYHMQNLIGQGIVYYDKKKGKYSVKISDELKQTILESLKTKKNLDELIVDLKRKSKSNQSDSSPLKQLIKDKTLSKKLNDILEFLFFDDLVTEVEENKLSGTTFKTEEYWTLTWKGCMAVGLCYVCRESFDSNVSGMVAHTIETKGEDYDIYKIALVHPQCVSKASVDYVWDVISEYVYEDDICSHCGLPLSEDRLRKWITAHEKKHGLPLVQKFLTLDEIDALNRARKKELTAQYVQRYEEKPVKDFFDGDLLSTNKFQYRGGRSFVPNDEPFDFLKEPKFSDVERLVKMTKTGTKKTSDYERVKELFDAWNDADKNSEAKIDKLIRSLFLNPAALIYPKIWHRLPGPDNIATGREEPYEISGFSSSHGYAFVIKDEEGRPYHEGCFQSLEKINQKQKNTGAKR